MAQNVVREEANQVELPVPAGTKSGDPVAVGQLNGLALTDRDAWTAGSATVKLNGSVRLSITGPGGGLAVGAAVSRDLVNAVGDAAGTGVFGHLLEPIGAGVTAEVEIRISNPQ